MSKTLKDAKKEAAEEVEQEKFELAKTEYKEKLTQLADAEKIVANIKREIEDLDAKISEG
jgi:hypothetical protein